MHDIPCEQRQAEPDLLPAERSDGRVLVELERGLEPLHERESVEAVRDEPGKTAALRISRVSVKRVKIFRELAESPDVGWRDGARRALHVLIQHDVFVVEAGRVHNVAPWRGTSVSRRFIGPSRKMRGSINASASLTRTAKPTRSSTSSLRRTPGAISVSTRPSRSR